MDSYLDLSFSYEDKTSLLGWEGKVKCKAKGQKRHTSCFITNARLNVILSQNTFCSKNCDSTSVLPIHIQVSYDIIVF